MTSDLDIYRAANVLIEKHGEEAPIHEAMRADELLEAGDVDGYAVWKRIANPRHTAEAALNRNTSRRSCKIQGQD